MAGLSVACPHCGGALKIKDRSALGKKVRCPKCADVFTLELPGDDDDPYADLGGMDDLDDMEDDFSEEAEDEEPRSRRSSGKGKGKKGKKSRGSSGGNKVVLLIAVLAIVGIGAIGGVAFLLANRGGGGGGAAAGNKINLAYLPPDSEMVMRFDVEGMRNSVLLKDVYQEVKNNALAQMQAGTVITNPDDLVSMTMGGVLSDNGNPFGNITIPGAPKQSNDPNFVIVIRTSRPFTAAEFTQPPMNSQALTHQSTTYYKLGNLGGNPMEGMCGYLPESNVMVMASEDQLKKVIERGSAETRRTEFDNINPSHQVIIAVSPKKVDNTTTSVPTPGLPPALQSVTTAFSKSAKNFYLGLGVTDRIDLEVAVGCADSAGAGELKTAFDGGIAEVKSQYEKNKNMLMFVAPEAIPVGDKTVASMNTTLSGSTVKVNAQVPPDLKQVITTLKEKFGGGGMAP